MPTRLKDRSDLEARIQEIRGLLEESDTANAAGEQRNAIYSATAAINVLLTLVADLMP